MPKLSDATLLSTLVDADSIPVNQPPGPRAILWSALKTLLDARYASVNLGVKAQAASAGSGVANAGLVGVITAPSFVAVAGRRYKITISWGATVQVGAGASEVQIHRGTPGTQLTTSLRNAAAGTVPGGDYTVTDVPGAGAVVYALYTYTSATTVQLQSNYGIIVEDIGT